MKRVLLYIWQLPQHLLALVLIWVLGAEEHCGYGALKHIDPWIYEQNNWFARFISGASLGRYIVLPKSNSGTQTILHEYGHGKQSAIFGPLYLFVIGIPSVFNNLWDRAFHKNWPIAKRHRWYYSRYPEKWADELGGVKRDI